mmetsp:Transcript_55416/g.87966  ORF Transcript_55416/g.87966 Transcript_55416/m.87966 type:complete len:319 (+) Transcript_55416:173-1129(+)
MQVGTSNGQDLGPWQKHLFGEGPREFGGTFPQSHSFICTHFRFLVVHLSHLQGSFQGNPLILGEDEPLSGIQLQSSGATHLQSSHHMKQLSLLNHTTHLRRVHVGAALPQRRPLQRLKIQMAGLDFHLQQPQKGTRSGLSCECPAGSPARDLYSQEDRVGSLTAFQDFHHLPFLQPFLQLGCLVVRGVGSQRDPFGVQHDVPPLTDLCLFVLHHCLNHQRRHHLILSLLDLKPPELLASRHPVADPMLCPRHVQKGAVATNYRAHLLVGREAVAQLHQPVGALCTRRGEEFHLCSTDLKVPGSFQQFHFNHSHLPIFG